MSSIWRYLPPIDPTPLPRLGNARSHKLYNHVAKTWCRHGKILFTTKQNAYMLCVTALYVAYGPRVYLPVIAPGVRTAWFISTTTLIKTYRRPNTFHSISILITCFSMQSIYKQISRNLLLLVPRETSIAPVIWLCVWRQRIKWRHCFHNNL